MKTAGEDMNNSWSELVKATQRNTDIYWSRLELQVRLSKFTHSLVIIESVYSHWLSLFLISLMLSSG